MLTDQQAAELHAVAEFLAVGAPGIRFDGAGTALLRQAASGAKAAADSVTWGIPGEKYDGAVIALLRDQAGQIGALTKTLELVATGQGADPEAIRQAAQEGAKAALDGLTLKAQ